MLDAHELYLLSVVFDVPIAYFFLPPPGTMGTPLADTNVPAVRLYGAILGDDSQLEAVDERLEEMGLNVPVDLDHNGHHPRREPGLDELARPLPHMA